MRITICDDQREILDTLKNMLEDTLPGNEREISAYTNADEYLRRLQAEKPDIALIDVNLSAEDMQKTGLTNGIDVARETNRLSPRTAVIFISGQTDYAEELYGAEHIHFLKKPITPGRLLTAVQKATRKSRGESITIAQKGFIRNIRTDDIVMAENIGRRLKIHITGSEPALHSIKLSDFEKQLSSSVFIRCHQSFIININHISQLNIKEVRLTGGLAAPVSRRYSAAVKEAIMRKAGGLL